jgi:hypothetical protein
MLKYFENVDDHDVVAERQRRLRCVVVRQALVDLVDDGEAAARTDRGDDARQFVGQDSGAGRVRRRRQQHAARALAPVCRHLLRRELEALLRAARDHRRAAFEGGDEMAVAGIRGVGHQHFVVALDQHRSGQQQRGRGAGGDDDALRRDVEVVHLPVMARDRRAQFGQAGGGRVLQAAVGHRPAGGHDHRGRGAEVRLTDAHADDRTALARQLGGQLADLHHVERRDAVEPRRQALLLVHLISCRPALRWCGPGPPACRARR